MAETLTIARPYAEAAFALALEANAVEAWSGDLERLNALLEVPEIRALIVDPRLGDEEKVQALLEAMTAIAPVGEAFANFVRLLVANDRLSFIGDIVRLFEQKRLEHEQRLAAVVTSAFPLEEQQTAEVARVCSNSALGGPCKSRCGSIPN